VSGATRHFLVYKNFDALLDYNCSLSYAITVALLGDAVASPKATGRKAQVATPTPQVVNR
jgi:membrane-bound lytic murein transglycosylase B